MRIELPPPPRKVYLAFSFVFFLVAAGYAIGLSSHWHSGTVNYFREGVFNTGLFALLGVSDLALYASRYSVEVSRDQFKVVRHLFGLRLKRSYRTADISHLRFTAYPNDRRRAVLSFDRKGRTRWLPMLEPEAGGDMLLAQVYAEFPNLSVRQKVLNIH